jgi:hypothetical protein
MPAKKTPMFVMRLLDEISRDAIGQPAGPGERVAVRRVYLHRTKSDPAHFGGLVPRIEPAAHFAALAARHETDPMGRWVLILRPDAGAKGAAWEGARHPMACKSLV